MADDLPINPTGFAHGFRPLEGDHPPLTPTPSTCFNDNQNTHRDIKNDQGRQGDALFRGLSGASTVVVAQEGGDGGGSTRKRRRLPGPLAFLQLGGAAGAGLVPTRATSMSWLFPSPDAGRFCHQVLRNVADNTRIQTSHVQL